MNVLSKSTFPAVIAILTAMPGAFADQPWKYVRAEEVEAEEEAIDEIAQVALLQPALQPTPAAPAPATTRGTTGGRQSGLRLASAPNMFGDLPTSQAVVFTKGVDGQRGIVVSNFELPTGGGGSRVGKIAENDSPIPQDRVFFNYNHFHNVFELSEQQVLPPGPPVVRQQSIDRYTIGFEKTFFDGWTSVEVRMPIIGTFDTQLDTVGVSGTGNAGNLTVVLKGLLGMTDNLGVGAGVAITTPTGSDVVARISETNIRFQNEATHLLPYIGFLWSPGDPQWGWGSGWFFSGFAQIDINTIGSPVEILAPNGQPATELGLLNEQNLGFLDVAAGYWLYRDPYAPRLTGLAAITELHYTTALQDADRIAGTVNGGAFVINREGNRFDVLNGTIGVQALLFDASSLRVAGVFPLGEGERRLFDSEVQVQFNRRF